MRLVMTVRDEEEAAGNGAAELRSWLTDVPELQGRVARVEREAPPGGTTPGGTMGVTVDALVAVLEPGGVAVAFAGALVAWVQTRRSNHTISVTRPDGTEITISSHQVRSMTPQQAADLAERLARPPTEGDPQGSRT